MIKLQTLEKQLNKIIIGKSKQVRLSLVCLLAKGHLLLEDLPGTGKTTLAKSFAALLGLDNKRVQFTADMVPSDITGGLIYLPNEQKFKLQKGPIFTNILLADEINRASPKCQSSLLEAMEELQVSIEGRTLILDNPFFVIATKNPTEQYGTFPLPESQLDRFLFKISLGYLDSPAEVEILLGKSRKDLLAELKPVLTKDELIQYQNKASQVYVSELIAQYVQALLQETRDCGTFVNGLSTRAGAGIIASAKAFAFLKGSEAVKPEDIQAVFLSATPHRLEVKKESTISKEQIIQNMMQTVTLPI